MTARHWQSFLTAEAEQDLLEIIGWTAQQFGTMQAQTYRQVVLAAIASLQDGPILPRARKRPDIGANIFTMDVAKPGKANRHLLLYRPGDGQIIQILRILHVSMDIGPHLAPLD